VAAVVDTGAGPSVVSEDLLPPGWSAHAWRAPTRTRIVDASGQALKALARLPLTLHVHDKPMHFPLIVVKRLSVPLIIGCDFHLQYTEAILPQDGKIEWSTGAVSDILGYHLGARGRQYKAPAKPRVRLNELMLVGATVLPSGAQTEVQVVTRSTGSCLIKGRAEFLAKHGLHLAHGHQKKVHGHESFSVSWSTWVERPRCFPRAPEWGSRSRIPARRDPFPKEPFSPSNRSWRPDRSCTRRRLWPRRRVRRSPRLCRHPSNRRRQR